jgi:hypothetical protein
VDILHERCAGLDIGKKDAKVCVRTPNARRRGTFEGPRRSRTGTQ